MTIRISAVACLLMLTQACLASAQEARTGFAADVGFGAATGKGGNFFGRDLTAAHAAASLRRVGASHIGVFGEIGVELLGYMSDYVSSCSQNGCVPVYPTLEGPSGVIGVIAQRGQTLEARAGIGMASYHTRSGGETQVRARLAIADVSAFPVSHVGLLVGVRWIVVPNFRGDRLSMLPWSIGLRFR